MTCSCVAAQCEAELCSSSSISVLLYRETHLPHRAWRCRLELILCLLSSADSIPTPLQGEKDWQKYETARRLKKCVDKIRNQYREDWKSKEMKVRQRAVALYFIDKVRLLPCPAGSTWQCCVFVSKAELSPLTEVSSDFLVGRLLFLPITWNPEQ